MNTDGREEAALTAGALVELARTLLVEGRDRHAFNEVLARLGEVLDASRTAIVAAHRTRADDRLRMEVRHQWLRPGTARLGPASSGWLPYFPRWASELEAGRMVQGMAADFPEDERGPLEADHVWAVAAVPVVVGTRWYGHLAIDDTRRPRTWTPDEIDLLLAVASAVGRGIELRATEAASRRRTACGKAGEDAVALLRGSRPWRDALPAALEILREGTRARSAWVCESTAGCETAIRLVAEALAPAAQSTSRRVRGVRLDASDAERFRRGETLVVDAGDPDPGRVEPGIADPESLRDAFQQLGVRSWMVAPAIPFPDPRGRPAAGVGIDSERVQAWDLGEREAVEAVAAAIAERMRSDAG